MPSPFGQGIGNNYERVSLKALFRGMDLAHPPDRLAEGRYPKIKNLRSYVDGELRSRPGLTPLFTLGGGESVNTIFRLNDPANTDYTFLVGGGTKLYGGTVAGDFASSISSGFSGDPLSIVSARPDRSPANWAYIADSLKLAKVDSDNLVRTWGIPEVPAVPSFTATPAEVLNITNANNLTQDGNTWNNSVNAGALSVGNRINTTITYIVYDSGSTGYCGISPATMGTEIQPGARIRINSGGGTDEYIVVEQVFALIASTTIESISYDSGTTGLCWIQLTNPTAGLVPSCLLRLGGTENIRVLEVVLDKDNKAAIRCSTTLSFSAGATVAGLRSFRCSTTNNHAAAETLTASYIQSTITYPGVAPTGVGNIRLNAARDLSKFTSRPVTDDDEVVCSIYLSDPSKLVEGRVWFDIDPNTTSTYAADDLSRNYLFFPFRPEDLQSFASFDLTQTQVSATAQNIQRYQFDLFNTSLDSANKELERRRQLYSDVAQNFPGGIFGKAKQDLLNRLGPPERSGITAADPTSPGPFQAGSGKEQWFTLRFKIGQLNRVGQDTSRTLKDVTSIMVNFKMSANSQVVRLGSWYISGGANPDMQGSDELRANAYYYIIQARDDRTGARSLPSPATRSGVIARRQTTTITTTVHPNAQVNKLDVYRWGGTRFQFLYLGSMNNSGTPTFIDNFSDEQLSNSPVLDFNTFPPFATVQLPFNATVNVVGPKVTWVSGSKFNTSWSPGTLIEINSRTYILYGSPTSDTVLYLTESVGTLSNVEAKINSPVVIGQPLPTIFGPYALGGGLFIFGVGDSLNPYNLYWTNGNDPDTTSDKNYVEVPTNSSELTTGVIYDGRPFLFSADQMFLIVEDQSGSVGASIFRAEPIANSRGCVGPNAAASDVYIYFVSKDGIYKSEGGQPTSITNDSLYPLFPHDGNPGVETNGISPPDYTRTSEFSLTTYGPLVYFDYPGVDGKYHTLIYDAALGGWLLDEYSGIGLGGTTHYGERGKDNFRMLIGGTTGAVAVVQGLSDYTGVPVQIELWQPAFNAGDERAEKQFGDYILDIDSGVTPFTVESWGDAFQVNLQNDLVPATGLRAVKVVNLNSGEGYYNHNLGIKIKASAVASLFKLYSWQPSYLTRPEDIHLRATDWEYGNKQGAEWFQGVLITADTGGLDQVLRLEFDGGDEIRLITINHNEMREIYYPIPGTPIIGHHVRAVPVVDNVDVKIYSFFWVTESAPEESTAWQSQPLGYGIPGWKHLRECWITYQSTADATLTITYDGATQLVFPVIPNSNNVKKEFYLPLAPQKFRICTVEITCAEPLRLYKLDTIFHLGPWGRGESYVKIQPFGGPNSDELSQAYV